MTRDRDLFNVSSYLYSNINISEQHKNLLLINEKKKSKKKKLALMASLDCTENWKKWQVFRECTRQCLDTGFDYLRHFSGDVRVSKIM